MLFRSGSKGITEEWLNRRAKTSKKYTTIFHRSNENLELPGISTKNRSNIKVSLNKQSLIISLGAKLRVDECKHVRDWFNENKFADFGDITTNMVMSQRLPKEFINNTKVQKNVVNYFSSFDESIRDFTVEEIPTENEEKNQYKINTLHKKIDSNDYVELPLQMESSGTLKMFSIYPELKDVLEKGSVLIIDELNSRLHPLLVRNVLLTFLNPKINVNHAQLIFTTHDTWQLSNNLLRRDEIWFTEKNKDGISSLYSLTDFVDEIGRAHV